MQKIIFYGVIIGLVSVVLYGFFLAGSPSYNRKIASDYDTLRELKRLHCALSNLYTHNGRPASSLDVNELNRAYTDRSSCVGFCYFGGGFDSKIGERYSYSANGIYYKICANFNTSWDEVRKQRAYYKLDYDLGLRWAEGFTAGRQCFERTIHECDKRN